MLKSKKIMIVIFAVVIIAIVGMIGLEVYAADNPIDLDITGINQQSDANQIIANQIIANQIAANQVAANSTIIQPTTNTSTSTNSETLPKTGVTEDITVMFFIIVCAISAIYAYKKIRDYKA